MARPTRPLISRQGAVEQAIALIDEEGLDQFSLPRLAKKMNVSAPSLYYHFADKDELLAEISRAILKEVDATPFSEDLTWQEWAVAASLQTRRAILRHENAAPIVSRYPPRDTLTRAYEHSARYFTEHGVPPEDLALVLNGLERLTVGAATAEAMMDPASRARVFVNVTEEEQPHLSAAVTANQRTPEELFADAIRAFLRGAVISTAEASRVVATDSAQA
ncbi:TetR family transcriptional regulator [Kribbia dieselivorans]|uniref:TetR family transcriptional regulator n=1 Tax=Kribbia dieselivorans TaxID=331526 RepID=UPI0008382AE2|nr:TetR family transcriptional regulator [Kribbia dieselivorans]